MTENMKKHYSLLTDSSPISLNMPCLDITEKQKNKKTVLHKEFKLDLIQ